MLRASIGHLTDNITQKRGLPTPRRRNDECVKDHVPVIQIRQHCLRTALHLMGQAYIDKRDELHAADPVAVRDGFSGNADAVPALDRNEPLLDFLLKSIQRITAHIIQRFLQRLSGHQVRLLCPHA